MKKLIALVLALAMVLMVGAAFADNNTNITITSNITGESGSVYSGYELLKVTADNGEGSFTYEVNPKYATILKNNLAGSPETDADVYAAISALGSSGIAAWTQTIYAAIQNANLTADATFNEATARSVEQGYWLIVESTPGTIDNGTQDGTSSTSKILIDTAGESNLSIVTKESIPTVDKSITGVNDTDMNTDDASVKVGDIVEYTLTGTLGNNLTAYKNEQTGAFNYYFEFVDTMSTGLELVEVTSVHAPAVVTANYVQTPANPVAPATEAGGQSLSIKWNNLVDGLNETQVASLQGQTITVTYTARVTDAAVITSAGNPNEVKLVYSNNPQTSDHGESLPSESRVYTYTLDIFKVKQGASGQEALNGAGFTLYYNATEADNYVAVGAELQYDNANEFKWERLAPGYYKLEETTVPSGYNKMNDIEFQVTEGYSQGARTTLECTYDGFTATNATGIITGNILNQAGTELPSTGGIGTTIFYILGGLLVIGAAVILVARRKAQD